MTEQEAWDAWDKARAEETEIFNVWAKAAEKRLEAWKNVTPFLGEQNDRTAESTETKPLD